MRQYKKNHFKSKSRDINYIIDRIQNAVFIILKLLLNMIVTENGLHLLFRGFGKNERTPAPDLLCWPPI